MQKPNWRLWRNIPEVQLWQAVALSLNLEPDAIAEEELSDWAWGANHFPRYAWRGDTPLSMQTAKRFSERLRVLYANLLALTRNRRIKGVFTRFTLDPYDGRESILYLSEFAGWALQVGFDIPPELSAMAQNQEKKDGTRSVSRPQSETVAPNNTLASSNAMPGKLPRIAMGLLAVEAAWAIEQETKRASSAKGVMARLQEWADTGMKPETLLRSDKTKRGVYWRTSKGAEKLYDIDACGKTLESWLKTRA